ncbi:MAG: MotA/TolQ/ExbB proton channel family protein, partial [Candidatus Sumerlaeia bacterium]|nr:MotA/TolQ/ExbB proton channel family protein [Candidatus Sumerlaeia bacterium]
MSDPAPAKDEGAPLAWAHPGDGQPVFGYDTTAAAPRDDAPDFTALAMRLSQPAARAQARQPAAPRLAPPPSPH